MKMKNFLELTPGTTVMIGSRRAKMIDNPHIGGGFGSTKEYGWAHFAYSDTKRKVTKRHRQVELIQERVDCAICNSPILMSQLSMFTKRGLAHQVCWEESTQISKAKRHHNVDPDDTYDESTNPGNGWRCPEKGEGRTCAVCGGEFGDGNDHTHEAAAGCSSGMVMPDDDDSEADFGTAICDLCDKESGDLELDSDGNLACKECRVAHHDCEKNAVPYQSNGSLGHGYECGICGKFLQAG